jgi:hypothetical protein
VSLIVSQISVSSNAQYGERVWTQWYCTQASTERVGAITCVEGSMVDPENPYSVMIKQGSMPFPSLEKAEGWLQSRIKNGSLIARC